ncbi:hypothetical protein [Saccharothrix obliqua]|uniref:hypothetical protein n=1 Tax=Saccharothrix obliqua TaxID=2861747 RepID=UPI001C5E182B|nr:hypothetical protein [Saccharothrix obliqua]MBW4716693.1 hypothetical protein [Saccharothrix obliqua]
MPHTSLRIQAIVSLTYFILSSVCCGLFAVIILDGGLVFDGDGAGNVAFPTVMAVGLIIVSIASGHTFIVTRRMRRASSNPTRARGASTAIGSASSRTEQSPESSAVAVVSRLLPADVRDEYREEWTAWMLDLRACGTPRGRRWIELLTILNAALRHAARRVVDR